MLIKFAIKLLEGNETGAAAMAPLSVDKEIEQFVGPTKYPESPTETPDNKADDSDKAKPDEGKKEEKLIPSIEDFGKVLPDAKKLLEKKQVDDKKVDPEKKPDGEVPQNPDGKKPRDYTGFSEQEAAILKKTSNEAFEFVTSRLKKAAETETTLRAEMAELTKKIDEAKAGKQQIPESYYDNPEAVYLTPEARELSQTVNLAQGITNHWKQQLLAIETGGEWFDLVQDPKTGVISVADKPSATPQIGTKEWAILKQQVGDYVTNAARQTGEFQSKLTNLVSNFKTKHEGLRKSISEAESKYMPVFNDPKGEDYKYVTAAVSELKKLGISESNPIQMMLAKSIALNMLYSNLVKEMGTEQKIVESKKADVKAAGPSTQVINNGSNSGHVKQAPGLADFSKMGLQPIKLD